MERLYERQLFAHRRTQARRDQQQATDLFLICSNTFANLDTIADKN
jgi:hypothetical protein